MAIIVLVPDFPDKPGQISGMGLLKLTSRYFYRLSVYPVMDSSLALG